VVGGLPLRILLGEAGIVAAQIAFLLLPALLFIRLGGFAPRTVLSLRAPSRREVVAGFSFFLGGLQLAWFLAWFQGLFMDVPVEYLEAMADALRADSVGRFFWLLFLAAVVPSVTEEVLFRGVLLSGLRSRLPAMGAVVLSGIVFGLFHLTPETAFRFLPSAWLGILLAWVVVATGSLPLGVLLHLCNNGLILIIAAIPAVETRLSDPEVMPPLVMLPLGFALLWWGGRRLQGQAGNLPPGSSMGVSAPTPGDSRLRERG
jgi:sodium transport system permease protein